MTPLVTAVIPTRNRHILVTRAISSALGQTYRNMEVIVVVDGPDQATIKTLMVIPDPRLTIIELPENVGGSDARNAGIDAAKGEWIAFLDDDDVWLPQKIQMQMRAVNVLNQPFSVISCISRFIMPRGSFTWPTKFPRPNQPICEYLFVRNTPFQGGGYLPTPTLLVERQLLELCRFTPGLKKHQDWDWVLRAARIAGVSFTVLPEILVHIFWEQPRLSTSSTDMWEYSFNWLRERRDLFTPSAYACFIASEIVPQAARRYSLKAFFLLLCEMYRFGMPRLFDFYLFAGYWILPQFLRRKIRDYIPR